VNTHYFAEDGNYGDAEGIVMVNTELFTSEDWAEIEEASDDTRALLATDIWKLRMEEQD